MDYTYHYDSPLGGITLASDGVALIGLWFDGQKYFADTLGKEYKNLSKTTTLGEIGAASEKGGFGEPDAGEEEKTANQVFKETVYWLDVYFTGKDPGFTPPLNMKTTDFRKRVWEIMLTIPFGQTMTYGDIAKQLAKEQGIPTMSAQAVGGAVGHNSISLIIPCHRVVGATGSLTGYAGGMEKKVKLLELEGIDLTNFSVPTKGTAL